MENCSMETGLIVTIFIAILGWGFAVWQMCLNRKWQKKDKLADRRYEAYNRFLVMADSIFADMKKVPQKMMGDTMTEFLSSIMSNNDNAEEALIKLNKDLVQYCQTSIEPMSIIRNELSSLKLVASDELLKMINKLQSLTDDLYNDFQNHLAMVNVKDSDSFKQLATIGQDERYKEYGALYERLTATMRKEIELK